MNECLFMLVFPLFIASTDIAPQQNISNDSLFKISVLDLGDSAFLSKFYVSDDQSTFSVQGRFDTAPTNKTYDFQALVVRGQMQVFTQPKLKINIDYDAGVLHIYITKTMYHGTYLYLKTSYQGRE